MSRFTSHSPLIKKNTLYLSFFTFSVGFYLPPFISLLPLSPAVIPGLLSLLMLHSSLSLIFLSHPLSPNSPASLYFYHSIAVISPRHRFNTTPPLLTKPFPPFLFPPPLTPRPPFHLDLYVSVGLSILLRPGSKLKWCWGLHWSLIEFKKRKCHKENEWWEVCNTLKGSPSYDSVDRKKGKGMGVGGEDGWKWKEREERRGGARKDKIKVKESCDRGKLK